MQLEFFVEKMLNHKIFVYVFYIRFERNELNNVHSNRRTRVITMNVSKKIIFKCFKEFENLNNKNETYKLSKHEFMNHVIELKKNKSFSYDSIYFLLENELKILKKYLNKHLKNDFIRFFQSLAEALILFIKKKNDSLRLYVNYKTVNNLIIKNKYSLSLIDESLNRLSKVKVYINLNFIATYHRMKIKKNDEWKTIFKIKYNHFEYQILFFDFDKRLSVLSSLY